MKMHEYGEHFKLSLLGIERSYSEGVISWYANYDKLISFLEGVGGAKLQYARINYCWHGVSKMALSIRKQGNDFIAWSRILDAHAIKTGKCSSDSLRDLLNKEYFYFKECFNFEGEFK